MTPSTLVGRLISHHRVVEKLVGGGMGIVYKAHDARLDSVRLQILKEMRDTLDDPERFVEENFGL